MNASKHNLDELLTRVAEGRLDELTAEQVAALEVHLNDSPEAAAKLAERIPTPPAGPLAAEPAPPTEKEWDAVWNGIEAGEKKNEGEPSVAPDGAPFPPSHLPTFPQAQRLARLWRPLSALAACVALFAAWHFATPTASADLEISLSDDVVIEEMEIFGDASAFVAYAGDGSGSAVIWILEDDEEQTGA